MTAKNPLLAFGLPPEEAALGALCLAAVGLFAALAAPHRRLAFSALLTRHARLVCAALAITAALLSVGYVAHYLRGGPRIIDASSYFLEARALAEGKLAFSVPSPSASFRGRFLTHPVDASETGNVALGVLFPPGYPAVLALGFLVGQPLGVGPLLGALLVVVTFALALRVTGDRTTALLAAALSAVCGALRYHTADTMSHGLAALLFASAFWAALTPREESPGKSALWAAFGGLCLGWLFSTRPVTGLACAASCAVLLASGERRRLVYWALGALPGALLLLAHQRALTGSFFDSTQLHYYALSDGPPGCFRLGLGAGRGCVVEHGDVVERFGPSGYTWAWALRHTLHRLHGHSLDVANLELLALLVPWTLFRKRARREARAILVAFAGVIVLYGAFYFNGSYPGGGARFFADLLPLGHVTLAWGAHELRVRRFVVPLALAGFAFHASYSHVALRDRDGGRPYFEPELARAAIASHPGGALVLVDSDHGFNLGHDPSLLTRPLGPGDLLVARRRGDDHDRLLWERLGRPPAYHYRFAPHARGPSEVLRLALSDEPANLRFEAEAEWPPLSVTEAWTAPLHSAPCSSNGRVLRLEPRGAASRATWELPVRESGPHLVRLGLVGPLPEGAQLVLHFGATERTWTAPTRLDGATCAIAELGVVSIESPAVPLSVATVGLPFSIDYVEIAPGPAPDFQP